MPAGCMADGKEVKFLCVGKKGYDVLRRLFAAQIVDVIELRGVKQIGFADADAIGAARAGAVRRGPVRRLHAVLRRVQVGDQRRSRRRGSSSRPKIERRRPARAGGGAIYEYEPDEEAILADLLPRNLVGPDLPRAARERRLASWAPR